jgi:hypothetical protein
MQPQIAFINKSKRLTDDVLAYAAKGIDEQLGEVAKFWDIPVTPVAFYAREQDLPATQVRIMSFVDSIDVPGAEGYHDFDLGVVYSRVLVSDVAMVTVTASHEGIEEMIDPFCDQWVDMGGGRQTAKEGSDAVEGDVYVRPVSILGKSRDVPLSNFLLPKWFNPAAPGKFDYMGELAAPFSMSRGGYMIVRDASGRIDDIFARRTRARYGGADGQMTLAGKIANGETRCARRFRAA